MSDTKSLHEFPEHTLIMADIIRLMDMKELITVVTENDIDHDGILYEGRVESYIHDHNGDAHDSVGTEIAWFERGTNSIVIYLRSSEVEKKPMDQVDGKLTVGKIVSMHRPHFVTIEIEGYSIHRAVIHEMNRREGLQRYINEEVASYCPTPNTDTIRITLKKKWSDFETLRDLLGYLDYHHDIWVWDGKGTAVRSISDREAREYVFDPYLSRYIKNITTSNERPTIKVELI